MILYRIVKERHADDLSGKGSELAGGRWNEIGMPALYLAQNISLSVLETIVHCRRVSDLHNRLLLSVEVPDGLLDELAPGELPPGWNKTPWHRDTVRLGSEWLSSQNNLLLKLPSALVSQENIFLVNPLHEKHGLIKVVQKEIFCPDNRFKLAA